eukprot:TRINITY_DN3516_c0_g1_i1.p1 TRINITY_DN3516_c0_g1~~TRINITY_DN3516_c0_g1_i1.p1  ORF type:complete len:144 (-),score=36.00 TRINITY_DN3516_c0_g1_i1:71-502(-)
MKKNVRARFVAYQPTLNVVSTLSSHPQFTLGVCSNNSTEWWDFADKSLGLSQYFKDKSLVIISQEVECAKPDAAIFQVLFDRILASDKTASKDKVIFIDDKKANIDAASQFGLIAIHYDSRKQSDLAEKLSAIVNVDLTNNNL